MKLMFIFLFALSSCQSSVVNSKDIFTIRETEDNIITGARKMIYNDSLLALIDVSGIELFVIGREGEIVKKFTPKDSYSDSITIQTKQSFPFNDFILFDDLKKMDPEVFKGISIPNYYTQRIYDCTIFGNEIGYSAAIATFRLLSDTSPAFKLHPWPSVITEELTSKKGRTKVDLMRRIKNKYTYGLSDLFYYGKYSNSFLSMCLNEEIDPDNVDIDTVKFDSIYRFIEYNKSIQPINLLQSFPSELQSRLLSMLLKDRVTQTSDSAFWSIGNYHDIVYNLKNGEKFQLNTPGNTCYKYLDRLVYCEKNSRDSLKYIFEEYGKYLNYEVLSIDATPEDDLIIDLLHATINQETGKKEQYHILQKYSRSGELLGEKVFPQDGKLGSLQRIAYCATRDEFAFLIFKDEKWLLAYSEEDKVW